MKPIPSAPERPTLGAVLRGRRVAAGLSIEGLAERCGVSARAISDIERDRVRRPQRRTLTVLLDVLAVPDDERRRLVETTSVRPAGGGLPDPPRYFSGRATELRTLGDIARRPSGDRQQATVLVVTGPARAGRRASPRGPRRIWPRSSPTAGSSSTCGAWTTSPPHPARRCTGCCAPSVCRNRGFPPGSTSGPRRTGRCSASAGPWWCGTTPPTRPRRGRCCPGPGRVSCCSPAGGGSAVSTPHSGCPWSRCRPRTPPRCSGHRPARRRRPDRAAGVGPALRSHAPGAARHRATTVGRAGAVRRGAEPTVHRRAGPPAGHRRRHRRHPHRAQPVLPAARGRPATDLPSAVPDARSGLRPGPGRRGHPGLRRGGRTTAGIPGRERSDGGRSGRPVRAARPGTRLRRRPDDRRGTGLGGPAADVLAALVAGADHGPRGGTSSRTGRRR